MTASNKAQRHQRVLITGCGGMLGNAVYPLFKQHYDHVMATDKQQTEPWLELYDVRDDERFAQYMRDGKYDLVLHLAAETDVEVCEADPDLSYAVNTRAARVMARRCAEHGAALAFISTAAVFDGKKDGPFIEDDTPSPIMAYGHHKLEGEHYVRSICPEYYIFRAGWMMGGGPKHDKKFVHKIAKQVIAGATVIHAVTDKKGTPGYTYDFAKSMHNVISAGKCNTYHQVCRGTATRYDVAKEILQVINRPDIELIEVSSDFFKEEYFAPRPPSEMMVNENLNRIDLNIMRTWQASLKEYVHNHFSHVIRGGAAAASGA
jgi:dTDP-4-dehydrorhamnose reductase